MNILDENIPESQRQLLRSWRIRVQQIGHELGHQGMKDEEIISLLHQLRRPTFSLVIWISMTISYVTLAIAWFV